KHLFSINHPVFIPYPCSMRTYFLLGMLVLGVLFPQGAPLSFVIRYSVMTLLFFAFLGIKWEANAFTRTHLWVFLGHLAVGFMAWLILLPIDPVLAMAGFLTGMMPTASVSPALTGYLDGNVRFVTLAVAMNTLALGVLMPFFLPWVMESEIPVRIGEVLGPVAITLGVPFVLARGLKLLLPTIADWIYEKRELTFWLFVANVYIAMAKASAFVRYEMEAGWDMILWIGLISLTLCILNYGLGYLMGGKRWAPEASMALGRKNTMFGLWLALTFFPPITALGPLSYILWHNFYFSLQMRWKKQQTKKIEAVEAPDKKNPGFHHPDQD
ncbi:MAG: hypothetical protein AAFV07_18315, partial [Bacteroidota bacterium]